MKKPGAEQLIERLKTDDGYEGQIAECRVFPPREPRYEDLVPPLPGVLAANLCRLSINRFYSHQAEAVRRVRNGENVVIVTETASGKSLCYNLPVLEAILNDPFTTALYVFPTKALSQDQARALHGLISPDEPFDETRGVHSPRFHSFRVAFGAYDGDTPEDVRPQLRRSARVILTNPDMLSFGILPNHNALWAGFFRNLRFVVLDEIHAYRGVFGSHVANVVKRLNRVCAHHGADPVYVCCSATIANPGEHAAALTGAKLSVVNDNGAPSAKKTFILWNPPVLEKTAFRRKSPLTETVDLFARFVRAGLRTIVFAGAKPTVEVILRFTRAKLKSASPRTRARIHAYRAGYLPSDRRRIERELATGKLHGVACTSALELGVDIGSLDAAVINGYPGTIASVWQQAGRAGRRSGDSIAVFVAHPEPLDQYLIRHPEYFFGRPVESAIINPENPYILSQHLKAAANELPLRRDEEPRFGGGYVGLVRDLITSGSLVERRSGVFWAGGDSPAARINLRSASSERYDIRIPGGARIGTMDASNALRYLHDGAVYLHEGDSFLVEKLDLADKTAWVVPKNLPYYTRSLSTENVSIQSERVSKRLGAAKVSFGFVRVAERVKYFRKIRTGDNSIIERRELNYPEEILTTHGLWFIVPEEIIGELRGAALDVMGGLHAVEHAAIAMLPLLAMCDRQDIGGVSQDRHPDTGGPTIFIHDAYDGGMGIAETGYVRIRELLTDTLDLVAGCPCDDGCPSCVQSPKCGNLNEPLDKKAAEIILAGLLT
ncbi:MAG: DEAD/DEAH box helicase [bacterium]